MTAGLAWLVIGERPSAATLGFSLLALIGVTLVVGSSARLSADGLVGDALAVAMTLAFAVKTVLVRRHASISMVPTGALGALMGCAGAAPGRGAGLPPAVLRRRDPVVATCCPWSDRFELR